MSTLTYRFYSSTITHKLTFDTESLPLWQVRSLIIDQESLISQDFDLHLFDNNIPLKDDNQLIHNNTSLILKRVPNWMYEQKPTKLYKPRFNTKPLDNYLCFRCGEKGHYISQCNNLQDNVKLKKPTGIPKAFLKKGTGTFVTNEGTYEMVPQIDKFKMDAVNRKCDVCGFVNVASKKQCGCIVCIDCENENLKCDCEKWEE